MFTGSNTLPAERHCSCGVYFGIKTRPSRQASDRGVQRKTWSDGTTLFLNGLAVEHQSPLRT